MRILYITSVPRSSNANVHVREFAEAARRLGHEVKVVRTRGRSGPAPRSRRSRKPWLRVPGLRHLLYALRDLQLLLKDRRSSSRLKPLLEENGYDFIYARAGLFDSAARRLCERFGLKLALEVNASVVRESRLKGRPIPFKAVARHLERRNLEAAHAIFTVSDPLKAWLEDTGIEPAKVHSLPNAVDRRKFDASLSGQEWRRRLGIGPQAVVVGFVGSFHPWQGAELLVDVYGRIRRENQAPIYLVLAGPLHNSPALRNRLEQRKDDSILAPGAVPHAEMPRLLAAFDICTAPYQPMNEFYFSPLKLFEYMAMGKAVVASRMGQIDRILEDGVDGLLVPPGDPQALQEALTRLIDDEEMRRSLGNRAWQKSRQYTWERNVLRVVAALTGGKAGEGSDEEE
ncbi:MAG TPA: glycosyltransferase family 4 protein [Acidobacteriota bacterium]|nr:glycosyltransferase family 4 protein [Acidobacteriota bacterium]